MPQSQLPGAGLKLPLQQGRPGTQLSEGCIWEWAWLGQLSASLPALLALMEFLLPNEAALL